MNKQQWLANLKPGDDVVRMLGGVVPVRCKVTDVINQCVRCGPYVFLISNGAEVDMQLGWDGIKVTGSYIVPPSEQATTNTTEQAAPRQEEGLSPDSKTP